MSPHSLDHPEVAFNEIEERRYKSDLELVDRYHAYAAELLRLALLGLAVFGFLLTNSPGGQDPERTTGQWITSGLVSASIVLFGCAAVLALAYRYLLTETLRLLIEALKLFGLQAAGDEATRQKLKQRRVLIRLCIFCKAGAVLTLALGAITTAAAFLKFASSVGSP
jgi:hypothetical protein